MTAIYLAVAWVVCGLLSVALLEFASGKLVSEDATRWSGSTWGERAAVFVGGPMYPSVALILAIAAKIWSPLRAHFRPRVVR